MFKKLFVMATIITLLAGIQAGGANADLITNGAFQSGDFTPGWILTGDTSFTFVASDSGARTSGESYAVLGSPAAISQTIATTAGRSYTVSFWLANDMPGTNGFTALWNGISEKLKLVDAPAFDWTQYQYTATALETWTPITFSFQNDSSVFKLTGVSAAPVPIPGALLLLGPGLACLLAIRKRLSPSV